MEATMTIGQLAKRAGATIRAIRLYEREGLLAPSGQSEGGYRLYDEAALERLLMIRFYRALETPLKDIRQIFSAPDFQTRDVLEKQLVALRQKRAHLDNLITLAEWLRVRGLKGLNYGSLGTAPLDEQFARAQEIMNQSAETQQILNHLSATSPEEKAAQEAAFERWIADVGQARENQADSESRYALATRLRELWVKMNGSCLPAQVRMLADWLNGGGTLAAQVDQLGGAGTSAYMAELLMQEGVKAASGEAVSQG